MVNLNEIWGQIHECDLKQAEWDLSQIPLDLSQIPLISIDLMKESLWLADGIELTNQDME